MRGDGERVFLHETLLRAVIPQQLFVLTEQAGVIRAGIGQKGRALVRRAFQRRVIERFDLLPALLVHLHFKEGPTRRESDIFFLASRRICRSLPLASQVGLWVALQM